MTATKTASPTTTEMGVKVGDFFSSSWGYNQTNVDFYKVVGVTAKSVKVQQWSSAASGPQGGPTEHVVPGPGPATWVDWSGVDQSADYWTRQEQKVTRDAPVQTKRVRSYGSGYVAFSVNSYSSASKWDGKPQYRTGVGFGH